jgi:hypothetical protein
MFDGGGYAIRCTSIGQHPRAAVGIKDRVQPSDTFCYVNAATCIIRDIDSFARVITKVLYHSTFS